MTRTRQLSPESPTILSFTGTDAIRFMNGQITQDASELGEASRTSCVTDAKGRLQYLVKIFAGPEQGSLWVTCSHGDGLRERMERYLIADDVEVRDFSGEWVCVHHSANPTEHGPAFVRTARGCFGEGFDCWWKADSLPDIHPIDADQATRERIAEHIPSWGTELEAGMLPPEAGLDQTSISYTKGCFIGQEVLSRIKSAGKLNRRLAAFNLDGPAAEGDPLVLGEKHVGHLTSVAAADTENTEFIALGYLKKSGFESSSYQVHTSGEPRMAHRTGWA